MNPATVFFSRRFFPLRSLGPLSTHAHSRRIYGGFLLQPLILLVDGEGTSSIPPLVEVITQIL